MNLGSAHEKRKNQGKLTILIPTRAPGPYFEFQISFWKDTSYKVLFPMDKALVILNQGDLTEVKREESFPSSLSQRLYQARNFLDTPYCLWLGDDDLVLKSKLLASIEKVDKLNVHNPAGLYSSPRTMNPRGIEGKYAHSQYNLGYSTDQNEVFLRIERFLENPIDRHFYAIQKSDVVKKVFEAVKNESNMSEELWYFLFPTFFELGCTVLQKTYHDSDVWYLKGDSRFRLDEGKRPNNFIEARIENSINREIHALMDWICRFNSVFKENFESESIDGLAICKRVIQGIINQERQANEQFLNRQKEFPKTTGLSSLKFFVTKTKSRESRSIELLRNLIDDFRRKRNPWWIYFFDKDFREIWSTLRKS